jgi:hypothetical protein
VPLSQKNFKNDIQFKVLSALSSQYSPLPPKMIARFRKSAQKRDPKMVGRSKPTASSIIDAQFVPSFAERCSPKLTVVAMARNEAERIHDSMRHFCALFDRVVLIDHLSEDETAQIGASYNGVNDTEVIVFRGEDAGYYQSEYMSAVANALIDEGMSDWIFFVDLDEYFQFNTVTEFKQALVDFAGHGVIHGHWYNLALTQFDIDTFQGAKAAVGPVVSDYVKVAINARHIPKGAITICPGNHAVVIPGQTKPTIGARAFGLLHVPIASIDAFRRKVTQGRNSLMKTVGAISENGFHWREFHDKIDHVTGNAEALREVALNYGQPLNETLKSFYDDGLTTQTRDITLKFAQTAPSSQTSMKPQIPSFTLDTITHVLGSKFSPISDSDTPQGQPHERLYTALAHRAAPEQELGTGRDRIDHALLCAATDVEVLVPSAWRGHIPFLFALMDTLRPQRYVELGTHAGGSFFAACQHIRSNGNYGEAVGIDLWTGDHQAGFYEATVFESFKSLLNKHFSKTGMFIRSYFADAASSFEEKSIDLLHIDGLHTYSAVKEDYQTWLSKLTDNGVIIFHDTNEFQTDFGVWQLFDEVRSEATVSFQFRHSHGLGVMAFGSKLENPAIEFLEHFNTRPAEIESYFSTLGKALNTDK